MKPNPPQFINLLKEAIKDEEEAKHKAHASSEARHYPSSASAVTENGVVGACLRQLYYRDTREPETDARSLSSKLQAMFGQSIHEGLLKKFQQNKKIKIVPESAGRILIDPLTREISFRLDGLVTYQGEVGCLEIKTQQGFGLSTMLKTGSPKDSDLLQVCSYFGTNENIRWTSLLYFSRDSAYMAEFHVWKEEDGSLWVEGQYPKTKAVQLTKFTFESIVKRWKQYEGFLETNTLPSRDYKAVLTKEGKFTDKRTKNHVEFKSDWRCSYCGWKTKCWSSEDAKQYAYTIPGG